MVVKIVNTIGMINILKIDLILSLVALISTNNRYPSKGYTQIGVFLMI